MLLTSLSELNELQPQQMHSMYDFIRRVLFCLFADDTGIFAKDQFQSAFCKHVNRNGDGAEIFFNDLFLILNTAPQDRIKLQDIVLYPLLRFPYVNGGLFKEKTFIPKFDTAAYNQLLDCCSMTWHEISPAVFGAMFQNAMDPDKRRKMGAHYTTEENILRVIKPLFLDDLNQEFNGECQLIFPLN